MRTGLEHKTDRELAELHRSACNGMFLFQGSKNIKRNGVAWYEAATGLRALVSFEQCRRRLGLAVTIDAIDNVSGKLRQIGDIVAGLES